MFTLFEFLALAAIAGFGMFAFRKYVKRGSALALVFASLGLLAALPSAVSATEFRKSDNVEVRKDETIKTDFDRLTNLLAELDYQVFQLDRINIAAIYRSDKTASHIKSA